MLLWGQGIRSRKRMCHEGGVAMVAKSRQSVQAVSRMIRFERARSGLGPANRCSRVGNMCIRVHDKLRTDLKSS